MAETLRGEARRRGITVWRVRNERRSLGHRDVVMGFYGKFPGDESSCPHCGGQLDRRCYPSLFQSYLDCFVCLITWAVDFEAEEMEASLTVGVVHVVPQNDIVNHEANDDAECPCDPGLEPVIREDGRAGWLVLHKVDRHM